MKQKFFGGIELEIILLHSKKLPSYLTLEINGSNYEYNVAEIEFSNAQYREHKQWKWYDTPLHNDAKYF